MPLYKRKPFALAEKPKDLKPNDLVFQVRFTKEIFKDYSEYLRRMNLYRHRVWSCKSTGKNNLTYEEALVSEKKAAEEVQKFPEELMAPVLRDVQFSMLSLKDLGDAIAQKLQGCLSEGSESYGRKNNHVYSCKIEKVVKDGEETCYEVAWLDKYERLPENTVINEEDLIRCKLRFSRAFLRSFIRESTYRSIPWVLHEKLAKKHGIPTGPPDELKDQICMQDGVVVINRKKKKSEDREAKENGFQDSNEIGKEDNLNAESIRYPIDDLLVQCAESDKHLVERPSPCREFNVPMECIGDLLMVWDFCTSFGRLFHLSPFSLEDFESAVCHKGSNIVLICECHSALLRFLLKDNGEYFMAIQKKRQKLKITLINWMEYLSDFLELIGIIELSNHVATIKRGHYGLVDIQAKLAILRELVCRVIETEYFKEKLDEEIEKKQALAATRRDEILEESRKKREEDHLKIQSNGKEATKGCGNSSDTGSDNHLRENGHVPSRNGKRTSSQSKHSLEESESELLADSFKKAKMRKVEVKNATAKMNGSSKIASDKLIKDEGKETLDNRSKDQRALHKMRKNEIKEHLENRSKEQRKEYLEREIEKRVIRTNPLGKDRDYNRYWFFRRDGRIFVESSDSVQWGYYSSKEELDALIGSLNVKGVRERALKMQLEKLYDKISLELQKRSKEVPHKEATDEDVVRRSTRVRAPPRDNPALAFLKYVNKWKED
ncbi:PREDICTED: DDT domain-containing protein DDB_G0282237 isoform X1 [Nicotiana attenuata]|uniref:Homeobox-ddt domain protein rlt1 n=1 Tax=Nicotiana attenuata TaxID=49451 RepID=A0A314KR94_NICAT|nr:PREDICTED: DDT domain-containing protein DDB_G0282237 isoform X1 [Nicotiana attenuata]OIT31846.1 homeobox-ddt domain protein rlt1 [Nicotiana attenuata]